MASSAGAQPLPSGVLFDDFEYESADWTETLFPNHEGESQTGSLYGLNEWVVSPFGRTEARRLWYHYGWQEGQEPPPERTLVPTPRGLRFGTSPGHHLADGCPTPDLASQSVFPQQIVTGFTARRGTWAAHVRLGALPDPDLASMIHAFWLLGPSSAFVREGAEEVRVTNEVDHEWNNRFLGDPQSIEYLSTGAALGNGKGRKAPMAMPEAPVSLGISYDVVDDVSWTCAVTSDEQTRALDARACSTLLRGGLEGADSTWSTLFFHIGDDGIRFGLSADVAGGTLEMASATLVPATQLPLFTLLSQHLFPGRNDWTCEGRAEVREDVPFDVDWFLYAEDPALSREAVLGTVQAARQRGVARLATVAGARLERPDRPVVGWADRWGFGARTTPLEIALVSPREMAPGETTTLLALPPERNGIFRYTWTITTVSTRGRTSTETRSDAFELGFTFPPRTERVTVRVRVEELDDARAVVRNETVQPVEREVTIYRRP